MQETQAQSLAQEDPQEREMATHPGILTGKIPRTEEPGKLQSMGLQNVRSDWESEHTHTCGQRIYFVWLQFFKSLII